MTTGRHFIMLVLAAVFAASSISSAQERKSAYDRLDDEALSDVLTKLRMSELLEALAARTDNINLRIAAALTRADNAQDPALREKYLGEAAELMRQNIKSIEERIDNIQDENEKEEALINYYNLRMKQVDVAVVFRGKPYIDRLLLLLGGDADRDELQNLTAIGISQLRSLQSSTSPAAELERLQAYLKDYEEEFQKTTDKEKRSEIEKEILTQKQKIADATERLKWGNRSLEADMKKAMANPRYQVYLVPELRDIQNRLTYKAAFLDFYEALALPDTIEVKDPKTGKMAVVPNNIRIDRLNKALTEIKPFVAEADSPAQPFAKLLQARCLRELGVTMNSAGSTQEMKKQGMNNYVEAGKILETLVGPNGKKELLVESLFEVARNAIEQGASLISQNQVPAGEQEFAQAQKDIDAFVKQAGAVSSQIGIDVKKLVLDYYLYEQWANALRSIGQTGKAIAYDKKIQESFMEFLKKYKNPAIQAQVGEMFAKKFRGLDPDKLDPVIVMLLAKMESTQADRIQRGEAFTLLKPERQKQVAEHRKKAIEMLEKIRNSQADAAKAALPQVLFDLGILYVQQGHEPGNNFKAAKAFRELVEKFPTDERAKTAALNAVKINYEIIDARQTENKTIDANLRNEYVASLRTLLKNWGNDPDASPFYFDLAWQCDKLAENTGDEKWLVEAIDNYEKVPASSPQYAAARGYALDNRMRMLETKDAATQKQMAGQLIADLQAYADKMHDLYAKTTDETRKAEYCDLGAMAEFNACRLAATALGDTDQAISGIAKLEARWPESSVQQSAQEFAIRTQVNAGKIDGAIKGMDSFRDKYGAHSAADLMQLVVQKIRESIQTLVASGNNPEKLSDYRKAYLKFAAQIYNQQFARAGANEKYQILSMYADSLAQSDDAANAQKALGMYDEMKKIEQAKLSEEQDNIRNKIAAKIKLLDAAGSDKTRLQAMQKNIVDAARESGLQDWIATNSNFISAKDALKFLDEPQTDEEKKLPKSDWTEECRRRIVRAQRFIRGSLEAIQKQAMFQTTTLDASMLAGRAHCYMVLKDYTQAIEIYRKLLSGLTASMDHGMYWNSQIELCQSLFDNAKDARDYKAIVLYINQLQGEDPDLGGVRFRGRLNGISRQAQEKAGS